MDLRTVGTPRFLVPCTKHAQHARAGRTDSPGHCVQCLVRIVPGPVNEPHRQVCHPGDLVRLAECRPVDLDNERGIRLRTYVGDIKPQQRPRTFRGRWQELRYLQLLVDDLDLWPRQMNGVGAALPETPLVSARDGQCAFQVFGEQLWPLED